MKLLYWRDVEPKNIDTRQILDLQFWPSCQSWIQFVLSELFNYCRFSRLGELGEVSFDIMKLGELGEVVGVGWCELWNVEVRWIRWSELLNVEVGWVRWGELWNVEIECVRYSELWNFEVQGLKVRFGVNKLGELGLCENWSETYLVIL